MYIKGLAECLIDDKNPIKNNKEKGEKEELEGNRSQISELAPRLQTLQAVSNNSS